MSAKNTSDKKVTCQTCRTVHNGAMMSGKKCYCPRCGKITDHKEGNRKKQRDEAVGVRK